MSSVSSIPCVSSAPSADRPISGQLRAATRDAHRAAEAAMDLDSLFTPEALSALLRGWVSVWQSVRRAAQGPGACAIARAELAHPATQALGWLSRDLGDLALLDHAGPDDDAHAHAVAEDAGGFAGLLATSSGSWGVAYVLRGSRLGGVVLAPAISDAVRLPTGVGTSFLRSAGTDPGREWVAFRRRLDSCQLASRQLNEAVGAAEATFTHVAAALSAPSAHSHGRNPSAVAR